MKLICLYACAFSLAACTGLRTKVSGEFIADGSSSAWINVKSNHSVKDTVYYCDTRYKEEPTCVEVRFLNRGL